MFMSFGSLSKEKKLKEEQGTENESFSQPVPQSPISQPSDDGEEPQSATPTTSETTNSTKKFSSTKRFREVFDELNGIQGKRARMGLPSAATPFPDERGLPSNEELLEQSEDTESPEISSTPQTKEEHPQNIGQEEEENEVVEERESEDLDSPCSISAQEVSSLFLYDGARLSRARDIYNYELNQFKRLETQGSTIKARIPGTFAPFYSVSVSLVSKEVESQSQLSPTQKVLGWRCSCPDGVVPCKHIGALLLAWSGEPERFVRTRSLAEILERKTRDELLELLLNVSGANEQFEEQVIEAATGVAFDDSCDLSYEREPF